MNLTFNTIKKVFNKIPYKRYFIIISAFVVWMTFLDENCLLVRFKYWKKINELKSEIAHYEKEVESSKKRLIELESDDKNLEKFAREQYLMKNSDEDIFIIEEE